MNSKIYVLDNFGNLHGVKKCTKNKLNLINLLSPNLLSSDFCYPVNEIEVFNNSNPISTDCNTFRVGMHVNIDPEAGFAFVRGNCLFGLDVALSILIANALGKKLVIVDVLFYQLINALQSGKIDMIASQMNQTSYRSESFAQIQYAPYVSGTFSLAMLTTTYNQIAPTVVNNDYLTALNNLNQTNIGIAVPSGTTQENYLLALKRNGFIQNINIVLVDNTEEAIRFMKTGYFQGYLTDSPIARNDPTITNVNTIITLPSEIVDNFAVGINIQCCGLIDNIYSIMEVLNNNGILKNLYNRYVSLDDNFAINVSKPLCQDPTIRCRQCFS